jgi:hypothetical protein
MPASDPAPKIPAARLLPHILDREPILQPPKPEIPPSPRILQRVMDRDADREAAD